MLEIKYVYKTLNQNDDRVLESVAEIKSKNYAKYIEKAKAYNKDTENYLYIAEVKDLSQTPTHTTCLKQARLPKTTNDFTLRAKDLKYSQLGNNPWDNPYLIPTIEF